MTPNFQFRLPESFNPFEYLHSPEMLLLADDARYLVSLILTKLARRDVDEDGHVRLRAEYLRSVMHKHHYAKVIEALLYGGAITRRPYAVRQKPFGYMLADRFRNDQHVRVAVTCPRLHARLAAFHEQNEAERKARMLPVHRALARRQRRLQIDSDLAREIIRGLPAESNPFDIQGVLVADIQHRDFHLNPGRYGRVTNNITSMKREVRPALRINQEPLHHVDIACCQPALTANLMRQQANSNQRSRGEGNKDQRNREQGNRDQGNQKTTTRQATDRTDQVRTDQGRISIYDAPALPLTLGDFDHFCELVRTGELYDFLLHQLQTGSCPNLTRAELKKRILADVLAKRKANARGAEYPSEVENCFRQLFPTVYRFIRSVNRDGWEHANLIRELQREESRLVIETVAAELLRRHPRLFVLTLHDAIYTTPRGIPLVVRAFENAFLRRGFAMTLKVSA